MSVIEKTVKKIRLDPSVKDAQNLLDINQVPKTIGDPSILKRFVNKVGTNIIVYKNGQGKLKFLGKKNTEISKIRGNYTVARREGALENGFYIIKNAPLNIKLMNVDLSDWVNETEGKDYNEHLYVITFNIGNVYRTSTGALREVDPKKAADPPFLYCKPGYATLIDKGTGKKKSTSALRQSEYMKASWALGSAAANKPKDLSEQTIQKAIAIENKNQDNPCQGASLRYLITYNEDLLPIKLHKVNINFPTGSLKNLDDAKEQWSVNYNRAISTTANPETWGVNVADLLTKKTMQSIFETSLLDDFPVSGKQSKIWKKAEYCIVETTTRVLAQLGTNRTTTSVSTQLGTKRQRDS